MLNPGGGKTLTAVFWALLLFARGSVHIASTNVQENPIINPNYFMFDWDRQFHIAVAKYIRRIFESKPLSNLLESETSPGFHAVAQNASSEDWGKWFFANNCKLQSRYYIPSCLCWLGADISLRRRKLPRHRHHDNALSFSWRCCELSAYRLRHYEC